jgi:hypothetical protein
MQIELEDLVANVTNPKWPFYVLPSFHLYTFGLVHVSKSARTQGTGGGSDAVVGRYSIHTKTSQSIEGIL